MINWRGDPMPSWNRNRGTDLLKGFVAGAIVTGLVGVLFQPKIPLGAATQKTDTSIMAKINDIDEKLVQMASSRCMVINTPVMSMAVYSTENLGVKKVPPPPKVPPEARRVALVEPPLPVVQEAPPKNSGSGGN